MSIQRFSNNYPIATGSDLMQPYAGISATDTTLRINRSGVDIDGMLPYLQSSTDWFVLTLTDAEPETKWEIVKVTAYTEATDYYELTIERGYEYSTAQAWTTSDYCWVRLTAGTLERNDNDFTEIMTANGSVLCSDIGVLEAKTHIIQGIGAPTSTPAFIGQHYIDTENTMLYTAKGVSGSSDWIIDTASTTSVVAAASALPEIVLMNGPTARVLRYDGMLLDSTVYQRDAGDKVIYLSNQDDVLLSIDETTVDTAWDIYTSVDAGASWVQVATGVGDWVSGDPEFTQAARNTAGSEVLVITSSSTVYRSTDDGDTYGTQATTGFPTRGNPRQLNYDSVNDAWVAYLGSAVTGGYNVLTYSTDFGATWTQITDRIIGPDVRDSDLPSANIFALVSGVIYYLKDNTGSPLELRKYTIATSTDAFLITLTEGPTSNNISYGVFALDANTLLIGPNGTYAYDISSNTYFRFIRLLSGNSSVMAFYDGVHFYSGQTSAVDGTSMYRMSLKTRTQDYYPVLRNIGSDFTHWRFISQGIL